MEAFSLLKYWRGGGGGGSGGDSTFNSRAATTIVTAVAQNTIETDDDDDDENDDDGPFFDLEFAVPDEEEEDGEDKKEINGVCFEEENVDIESDDDGEGTDGEREFNFTLSSGSSNDRVDQNLPLSPSDDLFFKGRLVPIEPSSLVINGSEPNSKPQFPVSFLKSATKFRVFMLGFKKSKMNATEKANEKNGEASESAASPTPPKQQQQQKQEEKGEEVTRQSKFFTVKFKVEEVPIVSLFTRENSKNTKFQKQSNTEEAAAAATAATSDEKRFSKEVMQKYLKKVKPLYIRVSKRYGEKLRFSGQLSLGSGLKASAPPPPPPTVATTQNSSPSAEKSQPETESTETASVSNVKSLKQGNLPAGLRVVCKHLGKSRSASSAVVAAAAAAPSAPLISRRRDDSLLQQQDGIQSAILHCKRSFNAARDSDSSLLSRSVSDPSHEKSLEFSRKSSDGGKLISNKNGS